MVYATALLAREATVVVADSRLVERSTPRLRVGLTEEILTSSSLCPGFDKIVASPTISCKPGAGSRLPTGSPTARWGNSSWPVEMWGQYGELCSCLRGRKESTKRREEGEKQGEEEQKMATYHGCCENPERDEEHPKRSVSTTGPVYQKVNGYRER